jgi:hypothetical protein
MKGLLKRVRYEKSLSLAPPGSILIALDERFQGGRVGLLFEIVVADHLVLPSGTSGGSNKIIVAIPGLMKSDEKPARNSPFSAPR